MSASFTTTDAALPCRAGALAAAYAAAAWVWLLAGMLLGAATVLQLAGFPLTKWAWMSPGRCWSACVSLLVWGFLPGAGLAVLRSTAREANLVVGRAAAWFSWGFLQIAIAAGALGILAGHGGATLWAEFPPFVVPLLWAALTLAGLHTAAPLLAGRSMPPATWLLLVAGIALTLSLTASWLAETISRRVADDEQLAVHVVVLTSVPAAIGLALCSWQPKSSGPLAQYVRRWLLLGVAAGGLLLVYFIVSLTSVEGLSARAWLVGNGGSIFLVVLPIFASSAMLAAFGAALWRNGTSQRLLAAHFWLTAAGTILLLGGLMPIGLGLNTRQSLFAWNPLSNTSVAVWRLMFVGGALAFAGQFCLIVNLFQRRLGTAARNVEGGMPAKAIVFRRAALLSAIALASAAAIAASHIPGSVNVPANRLPLANPNALAQWENLARMFPGPFAEHFGRPKPESAAAAIKLGRRVFIQEGCRHCHGPAAEPKAIRPGTFDLAPAGPPALVGPGLALQGGRHGNDWHFVHLHTPAWAVAGSTMPGYPWLFDGAPDRPTRRGMALVAYLQWLGSWLETYPQYDEYRTIEQLQEAALEAEIGEIGSSP